jgi:hypothetical protein
MEAEIGVAQPWPRNSWSQQNLGERRKDDNLEPSREHTSDL